LPEADWFESRGHGVTPGLGIVARFGLGGRDVSDRLRQPAVVEPVEPFEGGELEGLEVAPWPAPMDDLSVRSRLGVRI
jgi:hypothetical protein